MVCKDIPEFACFNDELAAVVVNPLRLEEIAEHSEPIQRRRNWLAEEVAHAYYYYRHQRYITNMRERSGIVIER